MCYVPGVCCLFWGWQLLFQLNCSTERRRAEAPWRWCQRGGSGGGSSSRSRSSRLRERTGRTRGSSGDSGSCSSRGEGGDASSSSRRRRRDPQKSNLSISGVVSAGKDDRPLYVKFTDLFLQSLLDLDNSGLAVRLQADRRGGRRSSALGLRARRSEDARDPAYHRVDERPAAARPAPRPRPPPPLLRERRGAHRRFFLAFLPKAALCCPFWGYTNNVLTKYKYTRAACTL